MQNTTPILIKLFSSIAILLIINTTYGQKLNSNWEAELSTSLEKFLECTNNDVNNDACRVFPGKSLNTVYTINDFYSAKLGRYLYVNEIADLLVKSEKWTLLGKAYDQKALTESQNLANAKKAAVAVYKNEEGVGMHVALILPGEIINSGAWGYKVPNSSSFFTGDPEKSFVKKGLSYAFTKSQIVAVDLYGRVY
jgi:hypothetical protein